MYYSTGCYVFQKPVDGKLGFKVCECDDSAGCGEDNAAEVARVLNLAATRGDKLEAVLKAAKELLGGTSDDREFEAYGALRRAIDALRDVQGGKW